MESRLLFCCEFMVTWLFFLLKYYKIRNALQQQAIHEISLKIRLFPDMQELIEKHAHEAYFMYKNSSFFM